MIDMTECFHFFIFHFFIVHTHSFTLMKGCVGDREENVAFPIFSLVIIPPIFDLPKTEECLILVDDPSKIQFSVYILEQFGFVG